MRILHVGASGTVGQAVSSALRERRHEVVEAHRRSADHPVSPTVLTEPRRKYAKAMPGHRTVDAAAVGQGYVRSVETMDTGHIYVL